jgi:hypothetical protein
MTCRYKNAVKLLRKDLALVRRELENLQTWQEYHTQIKNQDSGPFAAPVLNRNGHMVDFFLDRRWVYQIAITDLSSGREALDWCRQLAQKSWASNRTISEFCTIALGALQNGR